MEDILVQNIVLSYLSWLERGQAALFLLQIHRGLWLLASIHILRDRLLSTHLREVLLLVCLRNKSTLKQSSDVLVDSLGLIELALGALLILLLLAGNDSLEALKDIVLAEHVFI